MSSISCSRCGSVWDQGFAFCGRCGNDLRAQPVPAGAPLIPPPPGGPAPVSPLQPLRIRLLALRSANKEAQALEVPQGPVWLGREGDIAFEQDPLLDARHLLLDRGLETLDIVEIAGRSGAFRRVREPAMVRSGEVVFAGEQYLLVRAGDTLQTSAVEGPESPAALFGTPLPPVRLHVTQLLSGGLPGRVVSTEREQLTIGRDGSDMAFAQDRYMSGKHLRLQAAAAGQVQVVDLGSLNGTFVRVDRLPLRLQQGDEILIGSTLLRVDIAPR